MSRPLGDLIRNLRLERGLSQAELARSIGVSPPYLCDLELGKKSCSVRQAARVADFLGVPPERLVRVLVDELVRPLGLAVTVRRRGAL